MRPARSRALTSAIALLASLACGGGSVGPGAPRLVLLYAPCTVSKAFLSPYDDTIVYTPNLARFAGGARVFGAHQTEAGQSGIAYASLLSGVQADRHGIFGHPTRIDDPVLLLFESFRDAGYEVSFWNRQPMASAELGYAQGVPRERVFRRVLKGSDPDLREVLDRLASDPSRRALVVTNFHVSHYPYPNRIATFRERFPGKYAEMTAGLDETDLRKYEALHRNQPDLRRNFPELRSQLGLSDADLAKLVRVVELLYVSAISQLDGLFGGVLAAVERRGLLEESAIVFTADHGEVLYRENALYPWSHGFQLAPEVLSVPLLLRAPGVDPGRSDFVTRSIDVFPTLAGLAGVAIEPGRVDGVDLSGFLRGAEPAPTLLAFSHTSRVRSELVRRAQSSWSLFATFFPRTDIELIWVALRDGQQVYKLRKTGGERFDFELFDLAGDPSETRNLFDREDPLHQERARQLQAYKAELVARHHAIAALPELTRTQIESMRSLGYVR